MNIEVDRPLETREDLQNVVWSLVDPLEKYASPAGARVCPGVTGAHFPTEAAELEGFARPLWGIAPMVAGGGEFDSWERYREGLHNGTDPDHPEYWGEVTDYSQKAVEIAPLGVALALATDELWAPLPEDAKETVREWLQGINRVELPDNNWRFFRVLANEGLRAIGASPDEDRVQRDLDRLESFALGDGWYGDGIEGRCDYYVAWEMHTDGLIYATLSEDRDPQRAERIRERARRFASEFDRWFAADGGAIPYGRSLTYRFAQGAFWGALAVADVEAFPWGELKARWLRHLRWWLQRPIFTADGVLSLGYAYPTLKMTESYNSPSSPYWALKFFLPLMLPPDHPFWTTPEQPPDQSTDVVVQEQPGMVIQPDGDQVCALTGGAPGGYPDKYNKFAYSTRFGVNVIDGIGRVGAAPDGTLLVSDDGQRFRTRRDIVESELRRGAIYSRWMPWEDVTIETWLAAAPPWHVRLHRIDTERSLTSVEGGFPVPSEGTTAIDGTAAAAVVAEGASLIRDLDSDREPAVEPVEPNTNLFEPRTMVPILDGEVTPGTEWLATAVLGAPPGAVVNWTDAPTEKNAGTVAMTRESAEPPARSTSGLADHEYDLEISTPSFRREGETRVVKRADGTPLLRIEDDRLLEGPTDSYDQH